MNKHYVNYISYTDTIYPYSMNSDLFNVIDLTKSEISYAQYIKKDSYNRISELDLKLIENSKVFEVKNDNKLPVTLKETLSKIEKSFINEY